MKKVYLLGAGGNARSILALLGDQGFEVLGIYDDAYDPNANEAILGIPLAGRSEDLPVDFLAALAFAKIVKRTAAVERFGPKLLKDNLVHSTSLVHSSVQIGHGNHVLAGSFVNAAARLGDHNLVNTHAVIEHETEIGDFNRISVNATLCGRVRIGSRCFIGAGSVVIDKISICDDVVVGAGSVVIRPITEPGVYAGNPARRIDLFH